MKASFDSLELSLYFDFIAGNSSRHQEFERGELQQDAKTFELD